MYAPRRLYEEVAYLAYYFHWPLPDLLDMEHADRRRYAEEISRINGQVNSRRR
jgi:hypothetical protein